MPRIGGALKFGEFLLERSGISREALDEALETQRYRPRRVGRLLRDLGHLTQVDLNAQLALFFKPTAETSVLTLASELKARVAKSALRPSTQEWARAQGCELLEEARERLVLLSTTHRDEVLEEAEKQFGASCQILSVSSEELHFIRSEAGLIVGQEAGTLAVEKQATDDQRIEVSAPYTQLFREAILAAKTAQASDIHIQPTRLGVDIRFRVHGDMMTWKTLGEEHRRAFINEVKRLCNLSIATRGKDQDGRVSFQGWQLDLRVSLLPSQHDEKIVLRLLDLTREFDLSQLGFDEQTYGDLMDALQFQKGLILISGPTGSGKTTTLYTLLCALDRKAKNIITLEDPIEYGIEGLTQVQVSRKLSFAGALRSVLRQDPDVILVGEIRDSETADLCVKAASTGHLVLSTLHANGAAEVIGRLTNLGADPELLKSILRFSSAQRLVKKLCLDCSRPATSEEAAQFKLRLAELETPLVVSKGATLKRRSERGCPRCTLGNVGRRPVLEYMRQKQVAQFLNSPKGTQPELAFSLQRAVLCAATKGEVDYREVLSVE